MRSWETQLRKGLVELAVLAALRGGEAYGYQLLQRLAATRSLAVTESTVYPILARLAKDGLVSVRTAPSPAGPPRRYYQLTEAGRLHTAELQNHWRELAGAIDRLLQENP